MVDLPTVLLESMSITLLIAVYKGRKCISFNILGAFLQGKLDKGKYIILKLKGNRLVDMMYEINPNHLKNVRYEGNTKFLYLKCIRTIYGYIEAALQWYKLFTEKLSKEGFELKPYGKCVMNKIVNGKQCIIAWHIDDCMATHIEDKVLEDLAKTLISKFEDIKINRGKEHNFLRIKIKILDNKAIEIDMVDHLKDILEYFEEETGETITEEITSPAASHIFTKDKNRKELDTKKSATFDSITQKLLYLMKRARSDIETTVSFLMRRFLKSDEHD